MTSDPFDQPPEKLSVQQPRELPTVMAHLLGYHPAPGSLAILGLHDDSIRAASNIDGLNTPAASWPAAIAYTAEMVAKHGWEVVLLAYGSAETVGERAAAMVDALTTSKVPILVAARLEEHRLYCLRCTDCHWHDIDARPTDFLMARLAYAGLYASPDRQTFADQLAPVDLAARQRTEAALDAAADRLHEVIADPRGPVTQAWRDLTKAGTAAINDAIAAARHGVAMTDADAAWLLLMLAHLPARDHALRATTQSRIGELWRDLLRRAPAGMQAPPACLLAASALLSGDGHVAAIALRRALDDDPDYRLAHLLLDAMSIGLPPARLREIIHESCQDD